MSYNKLLAWLVAGLFSLSILMVGGVIAQDRLAIVDHLFDFHLNEEAIRQEVEDRETARKEKDARINAWVNEIRGSTDRGDYANDDRGTTGPPDRDN